MPLVSVSQIISAPIEDVWSEIRDFGAHSSWIEGAPEISLQGGSGTSVGVLRRVLYEDGAYFDEVLTALDDKAYLQKYDVIGDLPLPVYNVFGAMQLYRVSADDMTLVERWLSYDTPLTMEEAGEFAKTREMLLADSLVLLAALFEKKS